MSGSLRIGILPTIAPYLVPDFIFHFRKAYPNVSLFIDEKANKALIQELKYGNIGPCHHYTARGGGKHHGNSYLY